MRQQSINLIGGFYADDSRLWSAQDTCNWLPVVAEQQGTLTPAKLATPPGLRPYQQIGTGPIRGMHDCEGQRFVVSGRTLYRITNTGVGIPLGTVPGVGRVSISHNQFGGGNQVLVCNGAPGGGYVYDTRAQTFERITDPGFPGSLQTAYIDSYLLGVEPAGRFWFHSNLADATDYNTLDRYEAEAAPDRIVGLAVSQFEVIVFGERTAEFYGNAGGATGTFQSKRAVIDRGCASRHTICNLDNSVFWLGDDGIVYRLEGYAARRVSTVPLERALAGLRWSDAFAFAWEDKGHKVYYLTFPDGQTWGYDVVCGLWHRRESYGLSRWRLNDAVRWGNAWFGGDFQNGRIWQLDWDYPAEGDQPMVSERTSPVMADNQSAFIADSVELILGVGQQPVVISGEFPEQPPMPVISGDAPDGLVGDPWAQYAYEISSGTPPYSVALSSGRLPGGIGGLGREGVITGGTPDEPSRERFTVRVTDAAGMQANLEDEIQIAVRWYAVGSLPGNGQGKYVVGLAGGRSWGPDVRETGHGFTSLYSLVSASGSSVFVMASNGTGAVSSDRGVTWNAAATGVTGTHIAMASSPSSVIVACTGSRIARSVGGGSFAEIAVDSAGPDSYNGDMYAAVYTGELFVAASDRATVSEDDGATWSAMSTNYVVANGVVVRCMAAAEGVIVAGADGNKMAISENGRGWRALASPFEGVAAITAVGHSDDMWVAANAAGQIAYGGRPEQMHVSDYTLPSAATTLYAEAGVFVVGGSGGHMAVSENGRDWENAESPFIGDVRGIAAP